MQNTEDRKWLYEQLKDNGYDIGSQEEFESSLDNNEEDAKWYHEQATSLGLEVGNYEDFGSLFRNKPQGYTLDEMKAAPMTEQYSVTPKPSKSQEKFGLDSGIPSIAETAKGMIEGHRVTPTFSIENQPQEITAFGEGVKQGKEQLVAGAQYGIGEAAASVLGTSRDDIEALAEIERLQAEGKDVAEETKNVTDLSAVSPIVKKGLELMGAGKAIGEAEKITQRNRTIQKALKENEGDVDKAKKWLESRAGKQTWADEMMADATYKMAQAKPTKGWGWVGSMIPQMVGTGVGLAASMVFKSPLPAQILGGANMAGLTLSTAGSAMAEARQAGASNSQVWASGIANGAVELLTEKIPYNRYVGRITDAAKNSAKQALGKAVTEVGSPANKELKDLLSKANKQLGGKLFSGKNVEDYMGDLMAEGLSEATAEGLQTILPILYENPENYPTFMEILGNSLEGAKGGVFMSMFLGGASKAAEHRMNRARRKAQGYVDVAEVTTPDGKDEIVEVVRNEQDQPVFYWNGEQIPISENNVKQRQQFNFDDFERGQFQLEEDEAYENGKTLETPAEMTDANNMYEIALAEIRDHFELGENSTEDDIKTLLGGNLLKAAFDVRESDPKLSNLILKLSYATATRDGIIDAARDRISEESAQAEAIIDYRKNKDDGMIHPATLKTKDANGNDRQVYVVSGNIVTFEDGTINTQESSNDIIIQDAVTGKPEFATAKDLLRAEQAINPEVEKQNVRNTIADTIATEVENKMNNVLPFNVGDAYNIIGADGAEHSVQVIADNGDGSVMASIDNAEAMAMPKSEIQQLSNEYNMNRARLANEAQKEAKQSEKMMQESQNVEPTNMVEQTTEAPAEVVPERIVPTLKDGNPDFNAMDAEMFVDEYVSRYGEDSAVKIARKNISNARENIAKIDKKIDDITDPNQMEGLYVQRKSAEVQIARYSEILERLGASEDANESEADQRNRLRNDAGNRITALFPDGMPNVESFILADIATGNRIRWSDKVTNGVVTSRGLGAELGLSDSKQERTRRLPLIGKDAMTPEEYAESLRERLDAVGIRYDESSLRDAVLGVYQSVDSRKGAWDALENMSKKMQEPQTDMDWEDMQQQMAYNKAQNDNAPALPDMPDLETIEEEAPISGEEAAEIEAQEQTEDYKLSDEVDENGRQFVLASNGNIVFGNIDEESGLTPAPILLSEGIITNPATNDGYGLVHIEARHGDQIRNAGYPSVVSFIEEVAKNYQIIKEGKNRNGNNTYMLQLTDKHNNTLMVELSGDDTYWNINTAGIFKTSYGKNRKEVYNRQTTAKQPAEVVETSQSVELNGTQTPSSLIDVSTPKSSESKDTTSEPQKQEIDEKISQEEQKVNVNPTDGQKEAGNYKKGHVVVDGFNITIEQPKGSVRSGVDADGKEWSITMNNTYGYIRGTEGVDGDHIDVFLSDNLDNWEGEVFVVDQINTDGSFDEHKVMYGFNSIEEAQQAYLSNYPEGWQGLGAITGVSKDEFKKWIESSHRKTKPFAEYKSVKATEGQSAESVEATDDEQILFRNVYHGSGAEFDKFDHSFIGTGEGNQAFGWGTYVTEVEGIGKQYARMTSKPRLSFKGDFVNTEGFDNPWRIVSDLFNDHHGKLRDMRAAAERYSSLVEEDNPELKALWEDVKQVLSMVRSGDLKTSPARYLYSVEIPDNDGTNYLEYGKPLSKKQLNDIKRALYNHLAASTYKGAEQELRQELDEVFAIEQDGKDIYGTIGSYLGSDKAASEFLNKNGYVGISYPADGGNAGKARNYVIFNEADLDISDSVRFRSAEPAPVFYSNAEYAVKAVKQEKATPEQWLKMIEKNGGLKAGEDKWLGLSDWLKSSDKKTLTKQEVLDFIKENQIQIEEVEYGDGIFSRNSKINLESELQAALENGRTIESALSRWDNEFGDNKLALYERGFFTVDKKGKIHTDEPVLNHINSTRLKYTTYGLENKREIALTVPTIESWNASDQVHFGDAGNGRAIAWVRFGETTDADGNRVLVIDEIQSKRHQEGREKGYQDSKRIKEATQRFNALADEKVALVKEILHENGFAHYTDEDNSLFTEKAQRDAEMGKMGSEEQRKKILDISRAMMEAAKEYNASSGIPEAPFEKNWAELAMKRMLRYAAENGFDKIAWTTGEQQAERYDISKSVDNIKSEDNNVEETADGTLIVKNITIYAGGSVHNLFVDANGIVRGREYDGKKLSDIVGKPLAEKLMEKGDFELEGDGLRIGGEGMKAFYDQMIPSFMNKYGKKWGVKVGEVTMPSLEENNTMHSIDVTDAMRESVMQGQPMFRTAKSNFDSQFAELQTEYDALDKNDTETLNSWRDKKADVVRSYVNWVSDKFGLKCELYVFNGGREEEMRKAYDTMVEKYKAEGIEKVPSYESFKKKVSNPKVVATHRKSINFVTFNTSAKDAELDIEQFAETLFHENAHRIAQGMYSKQEFEQIWENAKKSKNHIAKSVEKLYSDKSDAQKGNEFIAKAIGELVRNHKQLFTKFLMGKDDISAEDLVKKLKYSLPLGKLALTETLNKFKDEYQERVLQGTGSSLLGGSRDGGNIEVSEGDGGRNSKRNRQRESERLRAERGRDVVEAATNLASSLGVKMTIIEDLNEINDSNPKMRKSKRGSKAWYNITTDEVVFVAPNATSVFDAMQSVWHEVVAHKGLRDVVGRENFNRFLDKVFQSATPEIRSQIVRLAAQNGWNFRTATEEYLASLAEEGFDSRENRTFWQKVRDFFMDMLREAKIVVGYNITDNDMRYMLWRTYQMQKSQGAMAVAEDVLMQQKLGVGNFRTRPAGTFDANNDDIRFRTAPNPADIEDGEVKGVREAFDKKVRSAWYQTKEAMYDNRQALKEYMRLATKAHGANLPNDDMKHIEAWENPYMAIMQKSSINEKEVKSWEKKYYHPILNAIEKIFVAAKKRDVGALRGIFGTGSMDDILNNYLQGKHGLERNRDMAVRNALDEMAKATLITKKEAEAMLEQVNIELQNDIITPTEADARRQQIGNMLATKKFTKEQVQAQTEVWKQRKDAIRKDDTLSWAEKQRALDNIAITEFGVDLAAKDYSGLGEVFPNEDSKLEQSIEDAYTAVEAFEELFDTKDLWDAIKAANNATIEKSFRSGIINKATMDSIRDMYDYYIPLRGFEAATTEDVYGYLNNEPRAFSMPVKRANGRASKAEFAIPHILQMAHSAILQGNNNLVKMKMANFAQHYPTDLIKQSNMYIEYDEVNDVWKAKYAEIPRDATPEEVDALIAEHNEKMAKAVKENPNKYRKVSGKMDVPYIIPKGMDSYHQIPYKRNGVDYVLTVNGDPRLAFVMNGELEKAATTFAGKAGEAVEGFTRFLAGMYTQYNPEFMLSNAFRDGTWVLATVPVRENAKYTAKFYKNYFKLIVPGVMQNLFVRYEKGTLDMSNDTHREFANFMQNGGETGYAILKDVENTKKRVSKDIHPSLWSKVMKLIDKLGIVGRGVESSARFAAYITSREEGRSITRSAYDAKEVSVNFNRKGAGAAFNDLPTQTLIGQIAGATAGTFKLTHTFFNAGMQGLAGVAKLVKYNPFKATTAFSSAFLLGMVVASLYDDDDEDYYNLTETVRRQNIIIRAGDQYVSIPLAIELRAMYGLGEMMVSMARGKEDLTKHNVAYKMADQILQAFPINILEGNGGIDALLPTAVALVEEVLVNEDWQGMPIYREDKYPTDKFNPEWQMVNNYTGRGYIAASKFLSEISGGDEGTRGAIEINPAVVQHIAEGILGGPLSFFDKTVATIDIARGKKEFEWRNIPFASRIIKDGGGKAQERANNREYRNNEDAYDAMHNSEKKYEKIANDPNRSKEDREKYRLLLDELKGSPEYEQLNDFHKASLKIDKMYRDAKKDNTLDDAMPDINKKKEEANAILDNK